MKAVLSFVRRLWKAEPFSAASFVLRAIIIALFFGVSNLLGLQEYTSFLSGTAGGLNVSWEFAALLGLIHLLLYVGFVLIVPVFLIAAGLLALWERWQDQRDCRKRNNDVSIERVLDRTV